MVNALYVLKELYVNLVVYVKYARYVLGAVCVMCVPYSTYANVRTLCICMRMRTSVCKHICMRISTSKFISIYL